MLNLLLVIQIIICVALVGVILLQRSEGGALGMGGSTGSLMTARGAGNLLTRTTAILATIFFIVSGGLTIAGNMARGRASVVDRLEMEKLDPSLLGPQAAQPTAPPPAAAVEGAPAAPAPSLSDLATPEAGAQPAPAPAEPAPGPAQ